MNETNVTAVGRVATAVAMHRFGDGALKATFRVACNERRRDWKTGNWVDGETLYLSVNCWRALAANVEESLQLGDPVVVRGRMYTRQFETEGRRMSVVEMDAIAVGPDLAWCTAAVTRSPRKSARPQDATTVIVSDEPDAAAEEGSGWHPGPLVEPESSTSNRSLVGVGAGAERGGEAPVTG